MIVLKTRSTTTDYTLFGTKQVSWWGKYEKFHGDSSPLDIFVEISKDSWKCYLGKIPSHKKSQMNQAIYAILIGEGRRGDADSVFFYRLVEKIFSKENIEDSLQEIGDVFEQSFSKDFVDSLDGKRNTIETNDSVQEKIKEFMNALVLSSSDLVSKNQMAKDAIKFIYSEESREEFLNELSLIRNNFDFPGEQETLVYTSYIVSKERADDFAKNINAPCLVMTGSDSSKYLEMPYEVKKKSPSNTYPNNNYSKNSAENWNNLSKNTEKGGLKMAMSTKPNLVICFMIFLAGVIVGIIPTAKIMKTEKNNIESVRATAKNCEEKHMDYETIRSDKDRFEKAYNDLNEKWNNPVEVAEQNLKFTKEKQSSTKENADVADAPEEE